MTDHDPTQEAAGANAALLYHPDGYVVTRGKLMGRHAAGEGFLNGFARHARVERFYAMTGSREHFDSFRQQLEPLANGRESIWLRSADPAALSTPGTLYVPSPSLAEHAWWRRFGNVAGYSITGITHTICTDRVMDSIGELLVAPVEEWDALICTSPAVRVGAERMLESYGAYLAERLGATQPSPRVQLPVIPLGVDCDTLGAADEGGRLRRELRRRYRIAADDIVVLFMGRLSFHAKAHPQPMYQALEAAAQATGRNIVLVQAGWFANDPIKRGFVQGARALCPSVRNEFVDGRLPEIRRDIWRIADLFCSFSDNVQETFGLTPVEAMAAGLPVVASDWDGYKGTVEQGVTGFLVPTAMPAAGAGAELAFRYVTGRDTYDQYIGHSSQSISVDARAAARAFIELIGNPELRARMADSGRQRARRLFSWQTVIAQYQQLWAELGERRRRARVASRGPGMPLREDPFAVFGHYATQVLQPGTRLALRSAEPEKDLRRLGGLSMNSNSRAVLANDEQILALLRELRAAEGRTMAAILEQQAPEIHAMMQRTIGWLMKLGIIGIVEDPA
jgi:glycosyltransferase involved in cell wall biosynthesis